MGDEAGGANALTHFLVPLHHTIDIHRVIIWAYSQVGPIGGVLQLMDGLLPVLDVHHLSHVSGGKHRNVLANGHQIMQPLHLEEIYS